MHSESGVEGLGVEVCVGVPGLEQFPDEGPTTTTGLLGADWPGVGVVRLVRGEGRKSEEEAEEVKSCVV